MRFGDEHKGNDYSMSSNGEADQPAAKANKPKAKGEPKHWLEYAIFVFVIATAIATSFAAYYTRQQWLTAEDQEKRSLRAYVYVTPDPIKNLGTTQNPEGGATVRMIGQTPAYNLKFITSIATLPYPLSDDIEKYGPAAPAEVTRSILFSAIAVSNSPQLTYLPTPEQLQILKGGTSRFYVWGRVTYSDAFDTPHHVLFCFTYGGKALDGVAGATADICNQHVEAD